MLDLEGSPGLGELCVLFILSTLSGERYDAINRYSLCRGVYGRISRVYFSTVVSLIYGHVCRANGNVLWPRGRDCDKGLVLK